MPCARCDRNFTPHNRPYTHPTTGEQICQRCMDAWQEEIHDECNR